MFNKIIPQSWFGRFFHRRTKLIVCTQGIELQSETFDWQQLHCPPTVEFGLLGCRLSFKVEQRHYTICHLWYGLLYYHKHTFTELWADANQHRLKTLLDKLTQLAMTKYLRQSYVSAVKRAVADEGQRWLSWENNTALSVENQKQVTTLKQWAGWSEDVIASIRENYIVRQLSRYAEYFDQVEDQPLSERQRRACIIDDDNNLLLAGAGTGKTSVMVGRTGYLIKSEQAAPKDLLLLAFGRKAANELDERITKKLNTTDIRASTFHGLGLRIIAEVEGKTPDLSVFAEDEEAKSKWVQHCFEQLLEVAAYRQLVLQYFSKYYYVEKNPTDFASLGAYYQYLTDNDVRSLKGDLVKSFGELYIANWLFQHGIEYVCEARYEYDVSSVEFRQYKPDFYLTEQQIYIEYYGIDENGDTAPYIDRARYHRSISWKRKVHEKYKTGYIELFYSQHKSGDLLSALKYKLGEQSYIAQQLPDQAILSTLREMGRITELAKLFAQMIGLYKAACIDGKSEQSVIANAKDINQSTKALELLRPVLSAYQSHLQQSQQIDFEDMIGKALGYIQSGRFKSPWSYIMVDELQDISEPRARLVRALRVSNPGTSVFAVGDDWQAIYRFSGADVSLTTNFAGYFGQTAQTTLDKTYRFNDRIGNVATAFVGQNPAQINKTIESNDKQSQPAVSILRKSEAPRGGIKQPTEYLNGSLEQALTAIQSRVEDTASVYLLARFWFLLPDKSLLPQLARQYPTLKIQCQSFHASKGKEADFVIVMGLKTGKHGFPSTKVTPALLDALLPSEEKFKFAEERRLFYVALTRAKKRVYVLADMSDTSGFVTELVEQKYDVELNEFATSVTQLFSDDIKCIRCNEGTLKSLVGEFGRFFGCSLSPRCKHTEKGCAQCESPMSRSLIKGWQVCLNETCDHIAPVCKTCNSQMKLKNGSRGAFWGCNNYNYKTKSGCQYTISETKLVVPEKL
ncbi:MAG: UvrD-helicase domain-containing protein [Algicola sp.]|nr:UvrD-helicase domain-containing protein [Algicola sp.]